MAYVGTIKTQTGNYPIGSMLYGTCETAANVQDKVVILSSFDNLQTGITIHVRFTNANTHDSPRLKVGSTTAMPINAGSGVIPSSAIWRPGSVLSFTFNNDTWTLNDVVNITASMDESSSAVPTVDAVKDAISSHAYPLSIATTTKANSVTLAASTKYQLTAGGNTYVFTTPKDTIYTAASSVTEVSTTEKIGTSTAYARADHRHSIAKDTITSALGYTPITAISTGSSDGTINVTTNGTSSVIKVKGLDSAAYTSSDDYLTKGTVLWSGINNNIARTITIPEIDTYKRLKIFFSLSDDSHWNSIEIIDLKQNKTFTTSITSQLADENGSIIQLAYTIWIMTFANNQWSFGVNDSGWSHTQEGYTGVGTDTNENTRLVHLRKIVGYKNY